MSLMEQFANPDMIENLSMADKLAGAGITTLMGMGIISFPQKHVSKHSLQESG